MRLIYQPSTWARGVHENCPKKGRHLPVHSVTAHHPVSVPMNDAVPSRSITNLCSKDNSGNEIICSYQTFSKFRIFWSVYMLFYSCQIIVHSQTDWNVFLELEVLMKNFNENKAHYVK